MEPFIPELIIESPGRINLIGEHTDYNMGYVLPAAIDKKITFKFRKNESDHLCRIHSANFQQSMEADLHSLRRSAVPWENYILGVLEELTMRSDRLRGFDCHLYSTIPEGSGVSSSAALECGLAFGLNELFRLGLPRKELVVLARNAEHNYVGMPCGIMDQFASVMSRADHVMLLDCRSLTHTHIPINIRPYTILLLNTHVTHTLTGSEYATRRKECEQGVVILQKSHPEVQALRDVSIEMLMASSDEMNTLVFHRCKFIIEENQRVLDMVEALRTNDMPRVGKLLYEGHEGLSTLYEISCPESDFLVTFSGKYPEVLGARQMGGGFGGCVLHLIQEDAIEAYTEAVSKAYQEIFGITLTSFEGRPAAGTTIRAL